jgi:hypothetical protein
MPNEATHPRVCRAAIIHMGMRFRCDTDYGHFGLEHEGPHEIGVGEENVERRPRYRWAV